MKAALLHKALLLGGGGECPKVRGSCSPGRTALRGGRSARSAAEEDRGGGRDGRLARSLTATGDSPSRKETPLTGGARYVTRATRAQGGEKGAKLVAFRRPQGRNLPLDKKLRCLKAADAPSIKATTLFASQYPTSRCIGVTVPSELKLEVPLILSRHVARG
jgi:hypothetical protein